MQVVCTHMLLSPSSIIWYQRQLGSKEAHRATHWPRVHSLAASAGVWLRANESGDQHRLMGQVARVRTLLTLLYIVIIRRLSGNIIRNVLYCPCVTSSMGTVSKSSSYSPVVFVVLCFIVYIMFLCFLLFCFTLVC